MEFSEHELSVMKGLSDPETIALLKKIFIDMPTSNLAELDKNIVALTDAEYGQLMKVKYLREKDNQSRINFIVKQTKEKTERRNSTIALK